MVGAVGDFAVAPGEKIKVSTEGGVVIARTAGGALRIVIDQWVRALAFGAVDDPSPRIALVSLREKGRPDRKSGLIDLRHDTDAIDPTARTDRLYDLGLNRAEARFCLRLPPGVAQDTLNAALGAAFPASLSRISGAVMAAQPVRVIQIALGRMEVSSSIPAPDGRSPPGPHTHLLPDHIAIGRTKPAGMDIPKAFLPSTVFYPHQS